SSRIRMQGFRHRFRQHDPCRPHRRIHESSSGMVQRLEQSRRRPRHAQRQGHQRSRSRSRRKSRGSFLRCACETAFFRLMKGAHPRQGALPAWLMTASRWILSLAVLALLVHFFPLATLRSAIAKIPPARFVIVLFLYLCAHGIGVLKWRMVVNAAGAELDFATSAQCYFGGLFGTLFLPSIVGGDVVRLAVGLRKSPRPDAVLAGNLADRFLDVAAQAGLVLAGLILLPGSLPSVIGFKAFQSAILLGILIFALGISAYFIYRARIGRTSWRLRRRIIKLRHAIRSVKRRPLILVTGWLA